MRRPTLLLVSCALLLPCAARAAKADKKGGKEKSPAAAFAALDADGDGTVSLAEYVAAQRERLGEDGAKKRFAQLDQNHDGKLTKEEFGGATDKEKSDRANRKATRKNKVD